MIQEYGIPLTPGELWTYPIQYVKDLQTVRYYRSKAMEQGRGFGNQSVSS